MKWIISVALFWLGLVSTLAGDNSPVGTWKTVDDETGRPKSIRFVDGAKAIGKINRSKA